MSAGVGRTSDGFNVLALSKDSGQRYVLFYDDDPQSHRACLLQLGNWAFDRELDFTASDAAALSKRLREAMEAKT